MSDNLTRAPAREAEAIEWIDGWYQEQAPLGGTSTDDSIFGRSTVIDAFAEGHNRGVLAGRAEWALLESLALVEARDLIVETAALLRGYEKHHRDEAFRLNMGTDKHRDRIAKAQRNGKMATKLERWLMPRPECPHERTVLQETGDGVSVEFCPECGHNIALDGKPLYHGGPVDNPAEVLRGIAERMVDGEVIRGVDHESFDRAAERLRETVTHLHREFSFQTEGDLPDFVTINGRRYSPTGDHPLGDQACRVSMPEAIDTEGSEGRTMADCVIKFPGREPPNVRPVTDGPLADPDVIAELISDERASRILSGDEIELTIRVIELYALGKGPFTQPDAARALICIRALAKAHPDSCQGPEFKITTPDPGFSPKRAVRINGWLFLPARED